MHARSLPLCHPSWGLIELSYQQISHRGSRRWHSQKDTHMGATNFKQQGVAKRSTKAPVKVLSSAHGEGAPAGHHAALWPSVRPQNTTEAEQESHLMLFTKGRGNNRNTISPGLSINLKANPQTISWKGNGCTAVGLGSAGPEETNYPPTCGWQLVVLLKEYMHGCLWITARPLSISPKNKLHAVSLLWSLDGLRLLKCGKCYSKIGRRIELHPQFTLLVKHFGCFRWCCVIINFNYWLCAMIQNKLMLRQCILI